MRAGIPWRLGVRGYAGGHSAAQQCVNYDESLHVGRAALEFARLLGLEELPENRPRIHLGQPAERHGAIVFAPGGGFPEKLWPIERFASLADLLRPNPIVVIGGGQDRGAGDRLAELYPNVTNRAGALSLREAFRLIAGADGVVTNSSMAMHAAAAFDRPCLVLLGAHFSSARRHAAQWAHPGTLVLGREPERDAIATAEEAHSALTRLLA
jgi:heptosyltransferase-2